MYSILKEAVATAAEKVLTLKGDALASFMKVNEPLTSAIAAQNDAQQSKDSEYKHGETKVAPRILQQ